jgi:uncharacterized phiE125 gp8 family phage protein
MSNLTQTPRWVTTVEPVTEPITIHEVKRQLNIPSADTNHDVELAGKIESARNQFERDISVYFIKRTVALTVPMLTEMQFPHRPINSITSITYYDSGNVLQTLSSSIYQLDGNRGQLRLGYMQTWPATAGRWDDVTITYVLGSHDDSTTVPGWAKSALLLLVANEFEQRDMMTPDYTQNQTAYERLVAKNMRSSYP